ALAQQAIAQEQAATSEGGVALKTITIRQTPRTQETPAPTSTVDRQTINRFGGAKIDDVLRSEPGVFTSINASNPGVAVNIRGFEGSGRVNMLIDGVPQSYRNTDHSSAGYSYIDSNLLADIDIQRGA